MQTVIVTGLGGQLAQYMIAHLLALPEPPKIVGTSRYRSFDGQKLIFPRDAIEWDLMELTDAPSIETLVAKHKPDYFINCAATTFVGLSWTQPVAHLQQNALGVLHQLEAIKKHAPKCRYFNSGSSEELGDGGGVLQNEKTPLAPRSPYGVSKACARHYVQVYRASYGLWACSNITFNFESVLRSEIFLTRKVTIGAARITKAIAAGRIFEPVEIGNFKTARAWQHASDVATAIWLTLNNPNGPRDYVISAPKAHTLQELVTIAFGAAGVAGHWQGDHFLTEYGAVLVKPNPAFVRPHDVNWLCGDSTLAQQELGWQPKIDFQSLIEGMVQHDLKTL